ncbi:MAG: phosphoribosylglycinamide formyltransferase [Bacilli bacterium]|nr:phosphoribosylglycinamide formyltransferase [Bacilli bacterium]
MKNIAIFASGTGSNFLAIHKAIKEGKLKANIKLFITDNFESDALKRAKDLHIETYSFNPKEFATKKDYEKEIIGFLSNHQIDLVVLAGYMRIIGATILEQYSNRIVNIHPSLLPLYKGKDAVGQALKARDKKTGVTVHFVDEGIDTGKIIMQEEIRIEPSWDRHDLELQIHKVEHEIYYKAIKKILEVQK